MLPPWHAAVLLAIESQTVIALRLAAIAAGGPAARVEVERMITEKIGAAVEAADTLLGGGSPDAVIARYREHVQANAERLRGEATAG
ncbi:conserved hypothetical protein; putative signal peptide [Methylobacterium sp. 4-46]|uniref:hypothetical protein n=1 Tax=unclassified Methylobacterium TaxID=2615210 RepID=UPI000152CBD3|nr:MULTISPECIES: hypothetical protein [Methylobacterium]ACA19560.1 conserved hypothetical protein; putative signal peptide [Methylobacterium sp. 4-46]WFT78755.1 hypothetical protein QA634_26340 [Methylobacterium nodulans]